MTQIKCFQNHSLVFQKNFLIVTDHKILKLDRIRKISLTLSLSIFNAICPENIHNYNHSL